MLGDECVLCVHRHMNIQIQFEIFITDGQDMLRLVKKICCGQGCGDSILEVVHSESAFCLCTTSKMAWLYCVRGCDHSKATCTLFEVVSSFSENLFWLSVF